MSASGPTRTRGPGIDAATRHQLVVFARRKGARSAAFTRDRPTVWQPTKVRNPNGVLDGYFSNATAWEFIASRLEAGEEVEVIELRRPPGAKAYVMRIDVGSGLPELYVKLQMTSAKVIGRSFHYSEHQREDNGP